MKDIIDQALRTYVLAGKMNAAQVARSRERMTQYIDTLISAGQNDPLQLIEYAHAYLKEMHEGRDPRFTGC